MERLDNHVRIEVADRGKGIPREARKAMDSGGRFGVGIMRMQERIRQLGGSLEISSHGEGTLVVAMLPVARGSSTAVA
jgi:signal transduction histidine kinase